MTRFAHDPVVPDNQSGLGKKEQVAGMFDGIAYRYDLMNRVLSAGIDIRWRKKALKELTSIKPRRLLDVATGTGDMAILAARMLNPDEIIGIDISEGMLGLGRKKVKEHGLEDHIKLLNGDSETINFESDSFDAVTVAFGVRNFENLEMGLNEIKRVLKPGARLVVLEFSRPKMGGVKVLYNLYMKLVAPNMGKLLSKNRSAYEYLDKSIKKFPEGKYFTDILDKLGYQNSFSKPLSLGICSIYCGEK